MNRTSKEEYCRARNRNMVARFIIKALDNCARFCIPPGIRISLYRLMGVTIGRGCFIGLDCMLDSSFPELIIIEDAAVVSFRVMIICHDDAKGVHGSGAVHDNASVAGVTLRKGCYVGAGAILLPGVEIGENAVVGAGAVVTRPVPSGQVVGGVPARTLATA